MFRLSIIAIMIVLIGPAAAQTAAELEAGAAADIAGTLPGQRPVLKTAVTVTSGIVHIGDLVENAGAAAKIAVFRAPDLGETGAVPSDRVMEALRAHDVIGVQTNDVSEVVVTRASRAIPITEFEIPIAHAFARRIGIDDPANLTVMFDRDLRVVQVESSVRGGPRLVRVSFDARSGRFDALFDFSNGRVVRNAPLRFTGTIAETVEVAVLARTIERGDIVKSSDVITKRRRRADVATAQLIAVDQAVGRAARTALRAGRTLRSDDLMKPEWVQRNAAVTLIYDVPNIRVTMRGKALETGSEGDVISINNIQSNRTVQGTVTGPGQVTVNAIGSIMTSAQIEQPVRRTTNLASAAPSLNGTRSAE